MGVKDTAPEDVAEITFPDYSKYVPFIYPNYVAKKEEKL